MRTIRLFFLLACCISILMGSTAQAAVKIDLGNSPTEIKLIDQNQNDLTIEVNLGSIELTPVAAKGGSFIMINGGNFGRPNNIGEPDLPVIRKIISIPYGSELSVEVTNSDYTEYSLDDYGITDLIMPTQPSLSKSQNPDDVEFIYNKELYQQEGYYSQTLAEAKYLGVMRSLTLGIVEIAPFAYDPVKNLLKVYYNVTVRVDYIHPDWQATTEMQNRLYSPVFEPVYESIINYEPVSSALLDTLTSYPIKYLIISAPALESQLAPFIEWKTKKGFVVVTAYTDDIGSTNTAIKNYIHNQYDSPTDGYAPSYVLLVGDDQQIPAFDGSAGSHITDLRFCEFTGDDFPEIYYGRFSAQTTTELQPQIDKTLEYEQYTMPNPGYLAEVTLIAGVDASYAPTYANGQINYGTTYYFNTAHGITDHTWLYPQSDQSGASAAIIETVNDGIGYINYTAHCGHTGFSDPSFTVSDIDGLTNEHMYLLGVGNCCLANTFGSDYNTPCFGEAWLQAEDKGGVGYIGGSNYTYWDEDYWWGVGAGDISANPTYEETGLGAYDRIFHDHDEDVSEHYITNGSILYGGNLAVDEGGGHSQYYWEIYHLMGDPSVMNYMGVPSVNNVVHSNTIILTAESFLVEADAGSYVGLTMDGVFYGAGYVGESGSVSIPLNFTAPGTADLVVTAQNRQPYISTVQVVSPDGAYITFDYYEINDVSGTNDGEANAGESIILGVGLVNVGPDAAQNVSATPSTSSSYVTITDNTQSYGTIAGNNGTAYSADAFALTVSPSTPDLESIAFTLTISGTTVDTWTGNFNIVVHSCQLEYASVDIDDAIGNANGILDPGESAQLTVAINNSGSGLAGNVTGTLIESDSYITGSDASGAFGDISGGNSGDNSGDTYTVTALSNCPQGHEADFRIALSDDLGYTDTIDFSIIVGDKSVIYWDDFSSNQGWTGTGGSGEWTIGSAGGGTGEDEYGEADPSQDHTATTDNGVLGNDITSADGDYSSSLSSTYYVTSPTIDCSDYTDVAMSYYHWLGIESSSFDHVYFQVYNGTSWVTLFTNDDTTIDEAAWVLSEYDLSSYADENAAFKIRFGIGATDGSWQYCGWNIDDIEIKGYSQVVVQYPDMVYLPSSIIDSLNTDETATHPFKVYNNGAAALQYKLTSSAAWLTCDTSTQTIAINDSLIYTITINTAGLAAGNYSGTLNYICNDPDTPSGTVPVTLTVISGSVTYMYVPGDANMPVGQWPPTVIGADLTYMVNYFRGIQPPCLIGDPGYYCAADINGDCNLIGSDVTKMVSYFRGLAPISYCADYPPQWLTPDDCPAEMPSGWPPCNNLIAVKPQSNKSDKAE